ncbi:MAG: hypothetical protein NVSMB38_17240 [Ktedonobacteraceae bacterium]
MSPVFIESIILLAFCVVIDALYEVVVGDETALVAAGGKPEPLGVAAILVGDGVGVGVVVEFPGVPPPGGRAPAILVLVGVGTVIAVAPGAVGCVVGVFFGTDVAVAVGTGVFVGGTVGVLVGIIVGVSVGTTVGVLVGSITVIVGDDNGCVDATEGITALPPARLFFSP